VKLEKHAAGVRGELALAEWLLDAGCMFVCSPPDEGLFLFQVKSALAFVVSRSFRSAGDVLVNNAAR